MLHTRSRAFGRWGILLLFSVIMLSFQGSRMSVRAWTSRPATSISTRLFMSEISEEISDEAAVAKAEARAARKAKRKAEKAKAKRSKFIGMAKAVDRGQFGVTYQPGGPDGSSFSAKSGLPDTSKPFTVLGIESTCDDTGAAIVRSDGVFLGEALASQADIHEEWGGIVPGLAKTAHEENMDQVIELALKNADMDISEVDAIGVTVGPGLEICLRVWQFCQRLPLMNHQVCLQLLNTFQFPSISVSGSAHPRPTGPRMGIQCLICPVAT